MKEDDWRSKPSEWQRDYDWTGYTVFHEKDKYPQILQHDILDEAKIPKVLPLPQEPTEQERELHNLTHLPFLFVVSNLPTMQITRRLPQTSLRQETNHSD